VHLSPERHHQPWNLEIPSFSNTRRTHEESLTALSLLLLDIKTTDPSASPELNADSTGWLTRSKSWQMQLLQDDDQASSVR
jgi:hypothetical protein